MVVSGGTLGVPPNRPSRGLLAAFRSPNKVGKAETVSACACSPRRVAESVLRSSAYATSGAG